MLRFAVVFSCAASLSFAALTRLEVVDRGDLLNGQSFAAGPYEHITARAYFEVDPNAPANRAIALIDRAPRNEKGRVEFSADFYIVKPRDPSKSNGTAIVEISNRGGKGLNGMFDLGDHFPYEHGFTLVWVCWEFDVPPPNPEKLKLYAPIATKNGEHIQGLVQSEWTGDQRVDVISLGDRTQIGYPVANPADPANRLTVRDHPQDERRTIPRAEWTFTDARHVSLKNGFHPS